MRTITPIRWSSSRNTSVSPLPSVGMPRSQLIRRS
ncbi:hypothetical protein IEO21_10887 [Rhodonia placenta]|uniref:Uncharacterized protein n=1 Tax=Rhodonia placenta TaxID=104341 RepID=A0A8H7NRQ7_9APHY|nr:hypothetical protein IEO21_10887 [Postia placenta]